MKEYKTAKQKALPWTKEPFDEQTRDEVNNLLNNKQEIINRFYKDMEFGTAGLRGIIGAGTNMMNRYTVARTTKGIADCINNKYKDKAKNGIVIGYDCRKYSAEFALLTAEILAANNIKCHLFDRLTPTPLVSYAVRKLKCIAGIMITCSHNPPEYNGYKVFWDNGAQIISPIDKEILHYIKKINDYSNVKKIKFEEAEKTGLINKLDAQIIDDYISFAVKTSIHNKIKKDLKIVYTPLHGVGFEIVSKTFKKAGFENLNTVEQQKFPDSNFPTVKAPNPELEGSLDMAIELAKKIDAEIILANDGDGDRIGTAIKIENGNYKILTGNQIGTLSVYYMLSRMKEKNEIKGNEVIISTVVSTPLTKKIAEDFNIIYQDTLTGFKWMSNIAEQHITKGSKFVLCFEESFGLTFGNSRDKDGIISILLLSEIASYCNVNKITIDKYIDQFYLKYGIHTETQRVKKFPGQEGIEKMKSLMTSIRKSPPKEISGIKVDSIRDILTGKIYKNGTETATEKNLPPQNLITFYLEDQTWISIRPSGTEPKIKIYSGTIKSTTRQTIEKDKKEQQIKLDKITNDFIKLL